jgi:deoxyribonuclease-4
MLDELGAAAGPARVKLVHANDSLLGCGSRRDRHERIGSGAIGTEPFRELLAHPALAGTPFVVETPGGKAGHARDIAMLKDLRASIS